MLITLRRQTCKFQSENFPLMTKLFIWNPNSLHLKLYLAAAIHNFKWVKII